MSKQIKSNHSFNNTNHHNNNNHYHHNHLNQSEPNKIYTVNLLKRQNGGLGFLIRQRDTMPYFSVWELIKNGSAEEDGRLKPGDIILKVNKIDISSISYEKGLDIIKSAPAGSLVELTMLEHDPELDQRNKIGFFSPIQKFRKKFISCRSSQENINISNLRMKSEINLNNSNYLLNEDFRKEVKHDECRDHIDYKDHIDQRDVFKIKKNFDNSNLHSQEETLSNDSKVLSMNSVEMIKKKYNENDFLNTKNTITHEYNELKSKTDINNLNKNEKSELNLSLTSLTNHSQINNPNNNNYNKALNDSSQSSFDKQLTLTSPVIKQSLTTPTTTSNNNNNVCFRNSNMNTIQIVQDGDDIRISIDGNIEILTNRLNDRKMISLSPQCNRKYLNETNQTSSYEKLNTSRNSCDLTISSTNININETKLETNKINDKEIIETNKQIDNVINTDTVVQNNSGKSVKVVNGSTMSGQTESSLSPAKINKKKKGIKLKYLLDDMTTLDILHHKSNQKVTCNQDRCTGSLLQTVKIKPSYERTTEEKIEEAVDFINQFYASVKREGSKTHKERIEEVIISIRNTGTYELKETELCFGARTAWRNAPRCIGRIQWSRLQVFDARYVTTARGMFEAICNHLKYATNKGNIRSAITIFKQRTEHSHDFRVWNSQFVSYAGYKIDENTVLGDKNQLEFTEICIKLGWKPKYTEFDVLPLVLQANGQDPEWFDVPSELILDVHIVHPKYDWFKDLNLKWYCVPGVSSMMLDVGGIEFTACPFNGWYMGTEIGRDLADINRYNKLPLIAEKMGLDIKTNSTLWKDKALVELNHAILYTFQKSNVTITDHHTASESFMKHYQNENVLRGGCPADWVWVVPPLSSHLCPVFHLEMLSYILKPNYEYQDPAWKNHVWKQKHTNNEDKSKRTKRRVYFSDIARAVKFSAKLMGKALAKRIKCTILYATETGKSERFAKSLAEIFKHAFDAKVLCMKDYDVVDLEHETLLLIVTSTFGNGDPPENGEEFKKILVAMKKDRENLDHQNYESTRQLSNVRFSVFGLGNSSYPKYCAFGQFLDTAFDELGAERVFELTLGDELCGQEESFRKWSVGVYKSAVDLFCIDTDNSFLDSLSKDDLSWSPQTTRLTLVDDKKSEILCESLTKLHGRKVLPCKLSNKRNIQAKNSGRVTLCAEISTHGYSGELEYKPGDHVGIFGENRKELVDVILDRVTNAPPPDQLVKIEILKERPTVFGPSKQWIVDDRYLPFTLRSAFTYYLDITSPLTQNMLSYLSTQTTSESERIQLEKLANDHIAYEAWKLDGYPNLAEVLEQFSSLRPNASLLITKLPKLQPRFYSISSSPKATDDINITVGVIQYTPPGKSTHYGVCSKWLDDIKFGDTVPTFVRGAPSFHLPEDQTCPIIMVGAGTGIAPFRSFWMERKIDMDMCPNPTGCNGIGWGKMVLYFGCRQSNMDDLYKNEIEQMVSEKVISEYYLAYSRELNQKKVYVQDLLAKNGHDVCDWIMNKNGHFYVCGDIRMAADVTKTLEMAIHLYSSTKMSLDEAKHYVNKMKENLRFHEDIFGNNNNLNLNNNTEGK